MKCTTMTKQSKKMKGNIPLLGKSLEEELVTLVLLWLFAEFV